MIKINFEEKRCRAAAYDIPDNVAENLAEMTKWIVDAAGKAAGGQDPAIGICTFVTEEANVTKKASVAEEANVTEKANEAPVWIIEHTIVDEAYGGQGIAGKLLACVVDAAKSSGAKIKPVCSYAVKQFEKKPEYQEIEYKL